MAQGREILGSENSPLGQPNRQRERPVYQPQAKDEHGPNEQDKVETLGRDAVSAKRKPGLIRGWL